MGLLSSKPINVLLLFTQHNTGLPNR